MKWNKKELIKVARKEGYTEKFKSAADFIAWADENGIDFAGLDTSADITKAFNKTVTVDTDAGEEVIVNGETVSGGAEVAEADVEAEEVKMEGEDDDEEMKAFKAYRAHQKSTQRMLQNGAPNPAADNVPSSGKRFGDRRSAKMINYDRHVKSGKPLAKTGLAPVFGDAERMEAFNASIRLFAMGGHDYLTKRQDENIATKNHLVGQNSTGGALVFGEYFPEVIENFSGYGAARAAATVTNMREGRWVGGKLHADITVGDVGEGEEMTSSTVLTGNVELNAAKSYALAKLSMELLNDAAVDMEDLVVSSMMRALRAYEDDSYFNGANNREGLASKIGANSTIDANLAGRSTANWGGYEIADIQNLLASVPAWALEDPNFGIACSWQFYMSVLRRFALSAGGNTGAMLLSGVAGPGLSSRWDWDGIPIYINNKAPKSYNADQIDAYAGAFSYATKFGAVTGSEQVAITDQRWFDEDKFGIRLTHRWAINCHDVNNEALSASTDAGSGVVALKA